MASAVRLNLANPVAVLVAVRGSRSAVIRATQSSSTLGLRALRPAEVNATIAVVRARCASMSLLLVLFLNACLSPAVTTARPAISRAKTVCLKCGTKKSGKLSCCARGGTWFQNCGDPGDSKFEHTWNEGINACRGNCDEGSRFVCQTKWCVSVVSVCFSM